MRKILVIGAQNIDIFTQSKAEMVVGDSNPAKINMAFGGVGRNIAVNLKRLGHDVHFLSVFGDDDFSKSAHLSLNDLGIETGNSLFVNHSNNSIYLGILDQENNLHLGFHDMELMEQLNPDYLQSKVGFISAFETIVIDNNLSEESIDFLLHSLQGKIIFMDAVSAHKARKLKNHHHQISVLKLNQSELDVLSDLASSEKQLNDLHQRGAQTVLLTRQEKDSFVSTKNQLYAQTPKQIKNIINTSGAGDAFLSGYLHGFLMRKTEEERLKMANFAAGITLRSPESTSSELSSELLEKSIDE